MSEAEKRKRAEYRKNRKKWLSVIITLIVLVSMGVVAFAVIYFRTDSNAYTTYTESGKTNYKVNYRPGFNGESEEGKVYIGEQVDTINAIFDYTLVTNTTDVEFEYEYTIIAEVEFKNRDGVLDTYKKDFVKELVKPRKTTAVGGTLHIKDSVLIDYKAYNNLAKDYIETHSLTGFTDTLKVTLRVNVLSNCEGKEGECTTNSYFSALNIPLTETTFKIYTTESVGEAEKQILNAEKATSAIIYGRIALGGLGLDVLLILFLLAFAYLTRNTDINYSIKVKKIVSSYKSFIQKIIGGFSYDGYRVLYVDTFREMLEIRDTIQSPILMSENEDCTCTSFLIPTNTNLLYVFEIKVDNYAEIYGSPVSEIVISDTKDDICPEIEEKDLVTEIEAEGSVTESDTAENTNEACEVVLDTAEEIPTEEAEQNTENSPEKTVETTEEPKEEAVVETATEETEIIAEAEAADGFNSSSMTKYDYSFEARLALSDEESRGYYSEIVAFVKSYGVKIARSWKRERIYFGRKTYANFIFKAGRLSLAFALNPSEQDEKYGFIDMSDSGKFAKTPSLMKITSKRKKKYATDLLSEMFLSDGIENKNLAVEAEYVPYRTRASLMLDKLIKSESGEDLTPSESDYKSMPQDHVGTEHHVIKIEDTVVEVLELEDVTVKDEDIEAAIAAPDVELEKIDYDEDTDPVSDAESTVEDGIEVIGVVWPEKAKHNKIYRYDPNGEELHEGDIVLAPSRDAAKNRDIVRKVAVAHANHKIAPEELKHPLKKIIGIVKRKAEAMLTPSEKKKK